MPDDTNNSNSDPSVDLEKKIADISNAAITSHLKRFEKSSADSFAKMLDERFAAFKPVTPLPEPDGKGKKEDPELSAYKTKLDEALKRLDETEKARAKAELARRDESAYSRVKSLLNGVRPELQETAAKILFHVDKRVSFDEQGNPLFKIKRAPAAGMAEEDTELPLEDGIAHWLKSKEAAHFVPAPQPTQTSSARGRNPSPSSGSSSARGADGRPTWDKPANSDEEKVRRANETEQWLVKRQQNL